jgi:microcin C transport system ATP-binding protein
MNNNNAEAQRPSDTLVDVRDLSVAFGRGEQKTRAVDRASFTIGRGETVALVGESGSGKTVSALSILRLLPYPAASHPTGEILLDGRNILAVPETEMMQIRGDRISIIFQEPMTSLNPLHTIEKQVGEVLRVHRGMDDDAVTARVLDLLRKVGLRDPEKRLHAYPHQLSGGQRQRVMIAMALANEPDLLIADEPTTALDVTIQAQILELLKDLQREMHMAMLLITHDLGIVRKMAERVYVMKAGEVVEEGRTEDIFQRPQHPYTRHLLAAEPKGKPPGSDDSAPVVVETDDLKVWFPIRKGLLRRTVDHVKAVDGLSLKLRAGQTLGVVGESGSGKTTLGLAILRLISSKGPIAYVGRRIDSLGTKQMRPLRKEMQIVFQDPFGSLSPRLSVSQIIEEGLLIQHPRMRAPERRERVAAALEEVGLDPKAMDRYPHEFSGGQRQRIAIARAMVLEPKFVMLDEPTSALDMSVQAQIVDLLRDLQQKRGLAYLFISHDLKVVRALCNYVIVLKNGRVVEEGPAQEIFTKPKDDYTRALLAAAFDLTVAHRAATAT